MKLVQTLPLLALAMLTVPYAAQAMDMGGPPLGGPMLMPNVSVTGAGVSVDLSALTTTPVLAPHPEFMAMGTYAPLDGKAFNRQYGWNLDSINRDVPDGLSLWVEQLSATPGLEAYDHVTYAPIFGTDGSKWEWDGMMAHNAYAVDPQLGNFTASYRVYLGDAAGVRDTRYTFSDVSLQWTSVPEPASLGAFAVGVVAMLRRRR